MSDKGSNSFNQRKPFQGESNPETVGIQRGGEEFLVLAFGNTLVRNDRKKLETNSKRQSPARIRRRVKLSGKSEVTTAPNQNRDNSPKLTVSQNSNAKSNHQLDRKFTDITQRSISATRYGHGFHSQVSGSEKTSLNESQQTQFRAKNSSFVGTIVSSKMSMSLSKSSSTSLSQLSLESRSNEVRKFEPKVKPSRMTAQRQSQKLKILATLLPDEILNDPVRRRPRSYNTALMFSDISGFTQLCQKYDKTGMGGPSRLTKILNGYIGSMIQMVLSRNGDVCKFGGDAFLCVWKVTEESDIVNIVHLAIETAVDIQKNCGEHKTDVGVKLGVKIALAAGRAMFSIIGTETRKHYVIVGPPVFDVKDAEMLCRQGDVIVAPSAWKYVQNYMLYSYTYHSDNVHIKVHDFGPLWKSAVGTQKLTGNTLLDNRPSLANTYRLKIEDFRPFILTPVMKSLDMNQSFDYLTEMRQVAIVFFNIASNFRTMPLEEIIDITNKAFQIVSGIVDKNDGAVNKLTFFDKDMAILVVFGLKGFKHELASQVALKVAYTCVEQLKKLKVNTASAGVTTGMAYCGVIGHRLRREYTVMGQPVNMAARLMCAYENMVSSDRDTFLHSKLESSHFEVLEQKILKGIQDRGPYYRFHLNPNKKTKLKFENESYVLLGRAKEIQLFEKFLKNSFNPDNKTNFIVFYGEARIGKSSLVAKFMNMAEHFVFHESAVDVQSKRRRRRDKSGHFEICFVPLSEDNFKASYSATRLIFQSPLGLREFSSVEEREDKILSKLGDIRDVFLLAALNPIFNVNFDLLPQYLNLNEQEQAEAKDTMVKNLYNKCFPKGAKWLIVIEDAEFMDEGSWSFLKCCIRESYTVLYLLTIGQRKALSPFVLKCLQDINPKKFVLGEIEKWYHASLACQILGVRSIPLELVNLIQSYKSSGNPGWLESFLLSLIQSGSIYISTTSPKQARSMRLVSVGNEVLEKPGVSKEYSNTYWTDCVGTFEQMYGTDQNIVKVCLLGPNFVSAGEDASELTMDIMFIKTLDTLKPLEQLVLKTGSVLGNNFRRTALKFVLAKDIVVEERQLAKAIRNLFEIKILTCAKGDLTQTNLILPRRMILVTSIRGEITCECFGLVVPNECKDLPVYANCGYMQFRSPIFRDTVYNLLLDEQKRNYHTSSIEFFRKNTFKCKFCNNEPFTNVFGNEVNDQLTLVCATSPMHGVRSTKLEPKTGLPIPTVKHKLSTCFHEASIRNIRQNSQVIEGKFGLNIGIGDCQCSEILSSVYSVLLEHAEGSGQKNILLEIYLEYAAVSLTSYNIPLTMQILEEALALVNGLKEDQNHQELHTPFIFSKIYTLMGATKLSMGRPDNSLEFLEKGLKYMKRDLPKNTTRIKYLITKENTKRKMMTEYFPEKYVGSVSDKDAPFCDLLSECLGLVSIAHMYMQNWLMAKYASLCALNKALESNRNFFGLCTAYTNIMEVANQDHDFETCSKMEICAIDMCNRCTEKIIEVYELEAVCRLYRVIFQTRYVRAEIEEAVFIGFQSIRIATIIRNTSLRLDVMPDLISALIQLNRLSEAVSLLHELEFLSLLDADKSSRIWYYAICLDFQLDTGFTILPFETCQQFVKEEEDNLSAVRDPNGKHRMYTSLWLWCLRNSEWEMAKSYTKSLKNMDILRAKETPCNIFTRLKRLEGFLITLVHRMDTRNIFSIAGLYSEISVLMRQLEKDIKVVKLLKPRYLVLKAYYRQIKYKDQKYLKLLNQAHSMAEKMNDRNTSQWIVHLRSIWTNAISPIQQNYWIEHCRSNLIDWHESEGDAKQVALYSLPLPKF